VAAGGRAAETIHTGGVSALAKDLRRHGSALFGVSPSFEVDDRAALARVSRVAGKPPALVNVYHSFQDAFDPVLVRRIASSGALPMVTWEPWRAGAGVPQPEFALGRIAAGAYDSYVREWARSAGAYGGHVLLRFAPEMNVDWAKAGPSSVSASRASSTSSSSSVGSTAAHA
jgi:hypothetical protein